jgi:hypothetical protein
VAFKIKLAVVKNGEELSVNKKLEVVEKLVDDDSGFEEITKGEVDSSLANKQDSNIPVELVKLKP